MPTDVGIVGAGYVGLPLAVEFGRAGRTVVCVDTDTRRVDAIGRGESYIEDVDGQALASVVEAGAVSATSDYAALADAGAILICLPTPLSQNREPDLTVLTSATKQIVRHLRPSHLVVLESTTYPGTTREVLLPILESGGLRGGADFHLAMSPERIDPGRADYTVRTTPKVIGGLTDACRDRAIDLYSACIDGFMPFAPGPGLGGHCLPIDPFYLSWKAREYDFPVEFIELAGKVNQNMPYHCADRIALALNGAQKPVSGSTVVILGVAYKGGVGDLRESPALGWARSRPW